MKKLRYSNKIKHETLAFSNIINKYYSKINKEYAKNMIKLIESIAEGENLDSEKLKEKYLNIKKKHSNDDDHHHHEDHHEDPHNEDNNTIINKILDKIIIDGTSFYYENKENGNVYNSSSKLVGLYKDNKIIFS
jgi:hypothetical protein